MKKTLFATSIVLASLLHAEQIKSIKYINLSMLSTNIANETLDLQAGDEIDVKKINKAIKKFYKFGYFNDIKIDNLNGNLELKFIEKPTIASVSMTGYKSREEDQEALFKAMGLAKGQMFTTSKVKEAKKDLLNLLEKEGLVNSVIEIDIDQINESSVALIFNINKGLEIIIDKVNYYGSDHLDEDDFSEVTANKEKEMFSWFFGQNDGEVKLDQLEYESFRIQDKYFQKGFLDSKVEDPFMKIDFTTNRANLEFFIEEGQQYSTNDIKIYLNAEIIDPETLYSELKLQKGDTFNISKLRKDVEFIKTSVADLGYAFAQVTYDIKKNKENAIADIVFNVVPGKQVYINDVLISGNGRTLDRVIRRNVYLAPGDLFNLTDFKDSKNKLTRIGFFEDVTVEQKRVSEDKMDLIVKVVERSTGTITLGGGYGSYDGFIIDASINENNVFGSGKAVGVNISTSDKQVNYNISYKDPAIFDSKYNMTIEVHQTEQEYDYSTPDYTLDKLMTGFSASVGRELWRNVYVGAKYRLDFIEEKYTDTLSTDDNIKVSGDSAAADDYYKIDEDYTLSSLTPYISYNSTDDFYFPRNGIDARTNLEYAGLGGDAEYIKSISKFKYYYDLEDLFDFDAVFRYRAQVNTFLDDTRISQGDSFYLGGVKTVRGFKSYAFGPDGNNSITDDVYKNMAATSLEFSFPLIPESKMRWGTFYDYGMIGADNFDDIERSGTGAFIEWISPFGPMQFIFAQPLDDKPGDETSSFEFSLGGKF